MKCLCAIAVVGFVGGVAGSAGAGPLSLSGDTCRATGNGTAYSLSITVPSASPQQFGFAFGAPGTAVTNIVIPGSDGAFSTATGPANTTGSWITMSPLSPGIAVANLTTAAAVKGAFTVVPVSSPQSSFLDPISCAVSAHSVTGLPIPSSAFTVNRHVVYDAKAGGWHLAVTIPGRGTVSAIEPEPTLGTASAKSVTAKSLVQTRNAGLKSRGILTLLVRPTPSGTRALALNGSLTVKLTVSFNPTGGKSTSQLIKLNLRKST